MQRMKKTILVTGGAGFIGTNLCRRLVAEGHRVISLDNYFAGSKDNHIEGVEYREGHTKDIAKHISEKPDLIYHLGEYSRVEQSVLEPEVVHDLNVLGTQGVLAFWQACGTKLVYAGSSTKFGDGGKTRETSPYASSKAANTELVKEIGESKKLPYAITYFYNVYGPGERAGAYGTVIEAFKQQYLRGTPFTITAPGTQVRNFTHVDDIVDGLVLVGEKGDGDEYGLGNEECFSILDVAKLFGNDIIMLPERAGNRTRSSLEVTKTSALGWKAKRGLREYIAEFVATHEKGTPIERRVLVFATTFYPTMGPAENALLELVRVMPKVEFDVVTSAFSKTALSTSSPLPNLKIHRVGYGNRFDKFLLPLFGYRCAKKLHYDHSYLFTWSLMASYGALAGVFLKRQNKLPLLITLADQDIESLSTVKRGVLSMILSDADQVYGGNHAQEKHARLIAGGTIHRKSLGDGDAFANQIRFVYSSMLQKGKASL